MANRYWVGGTASWDGNAGTKWALTSGGAGGQAVPTSADDVFFDGASGASTVTIATGNTGAKSITCTGFTGTIAGSATIAVSGSVTLVAGMTFTYSGQFTLDATGTLTSAGKTLGSVLISSGGTATLGDALTCTGTITVSSGTFNTANFNVTASDITSSNSTVRTITLGSSTVTLSSNAPIGFSTSTNLTFNANTSQINCSGTSIVFSGGSQTFYNVSFTSTVGGALHTINGTNTFNNLTVTPPATSFRNQLLFSANQTINGTLTCAGATVLRRIQIRSNTIGTTRTLTVATLSANDCDFRDITIAGAAANGSPTRAGDCGGNSGVIFPASKTVYRVGTNATWSGSSSWATLSGGAGADNNFPLAQDTAVIDNSTTLTGTLNISIFNISSINASTRTTAITLSFSANDIYGSFTFGSGITVSGAGKQTFSGRGTMDFTSAGKTVTFSIGVDAPGGTFRLLDAFNSSSATSTDLIRGTLDLNNFNFTALTFAGTGSFTRTLAFGTGTFTISGSGTAWTTATSTNLTVTGPGTISMTSASAKTFAGGGANYGSVTLNNGGAGALTITGSNTFGSLSNSVQPTTFTFTAGTTTTISTWAIAGTPGNLVTIGSATAASHTLSKASGTVSADYLSISRSTATGGATWYAGANSTNGGNNTGWIFTAPPVGGVNANFFLLF